MAQKINDSLFVNKAGVLCAKYGPWDTVAEFLSEVGSGFRTPGLTFGVRDGLRVVEYWLQGGTGEAHVELKFGEVLGEGEMSAWIRRPVLAVVEDLPVYFDDGDRYLHNQIIKEYKVDQWVDMVGGTGAAYIDGMAVVVNEDGELKNSIFVYDTATGEWERFIDRAELPKENINETHILQLHLVSPDDGSLWKVTITAAGAFNIESIA